MASESRSSCIQNGTDTSMRYAVHPPCMLSPKLHISVLSYLWCSTKDARELTLGHIDLENQFHLLLAWLLRLVIQVCLNCLQPLCYRSTEACTLGCAVVESNHTLFRLRGEISLGRAYCVDEPKYSFAGRHVVAGGA